MAKKVRKRSKAGVETDFQTLCRRLRRDGRFRAAALNFLEAEVREHNKEKIDYLAGVEPNDAFSFSKLASRLGATFRTLNRKKPHFGGKGKTKILQVHGLARHRLDLANVRENIRETNGGVIPSQFVPVTIALFSTARELDGAPVVSLNRGCPICRDRHPPE